MVNKIDFNNIKSTNNHVILDVRTKLEHLVEHIKIDHVNIPLHLLNVQDFVKNYVKNNEKIYILCKSGMRAKRAYDMFKNANINGLKMDNVYIINGGISSCKSEDCNYNRSAKMKITLVKYGILALILLGLMKIFS